MSEAKVALGRRLFHETRLSSTGQYACHSCHRPELAFTDGRPRAVGATGETVKHAAMSLANVAYNPSFTWSDARVRSLESQMRQPLFNRHPVEMGLTGDAPDAVAALSADADYRRQFAAAFPGDAAPLSMDHIIKAIAAFERTLISGRSAFDRYVYDDDREALSGPAKHGMALFFSAHAGCAQCHFGLNFSGPLVYEGHSEGRAIFADTGLAADPGKFRVPTLRNVALTAPYLHDGSLASLDEVIDRYARGGRAHQRSQDSRVRPLSLSPVERADLLAFLQSLTDAEFIDEPRFR
jgi:cytochrome c peroxidase